jgi:hypothetical protein
MKADCGLERCSGGSIIFWMCRQMILAIALCRPTEFSPKGKVQMFGYQAFRRVL